ncbi:hypothetical protein C8R43DRAFT_1118386 [Mycena crocata]|nr:hypothetical protein C8R43DRAFT_1118386 [Mycena crocata]
MESQARVGQFRVSNNAVVQRVEYLDFIPPIFPVPEISTAFVLDLSHPKFDIRDNAGKMYPVDALVKSEDHDSWIGADWPVLVSFEPDQLPILCRQSRLKCKGSFTCEHLDSKLVAVARRVAARWTLDLVMLSYIQPWAPSSSIAVR